MQIIFLFPTRRLLQQIWGGNWADQSHPAIDAYGLHITVKVLNKIN